VGVQSDKMRHKIKLGSGMESGISQLKLNWKKVFVGFHINYSVPEERTRSLSHIK